MIIKSCNSPSNPDTLTGKSQSNYLNWWKGLITNLS
ncbi:MAG: hypothetical protein DRH26_02365, partial [Deltaproteobacteria bacterium]